jgi:hypothetical protein
MGRINGINSDYKKIDGTITKVTPEPANLELKLFLCPYDEPNGLEEESGICNGLKGSCPNAGPKSGHALLHLSQTEGINLVTDDGTKLQLHQNTGPNAGVIALSPASGKVRIDGAVELVAGGHTLTITPSGTGITLQHANGARVVFKTNGDLDLVTKNNTGTVNIQGNLVVSGTLSRNGSPV